MAENQGKCTGNCMACTILQRQYCSSQLAYSNMRMLELLDQKLTNMQEKIEAIQSNEGTLFYPTMTEEENNHLAEKICEADIDRLWNSDYTVLCPEQSAIGTMCEMGVLYGWKYMTNKLINIIRKELLDNSKTYGQILEDVVREIIRINEKQNFAHYFDIRTNHLNEKDWRRSFSINQMLYGMILYATADHELHNSFDEIIPLLKERYGSEANESPCINQSWHSHTNQCDKDANS